jgi:hypothetical protein
MNPRLLEWAIRAESLSLISVAKRISGSTRGRVDAMLVQAGAVRHMSKGTGPSRENRIAPVLAKSRVNSPPPR